MRPQTITKIYVGASSNEIARATMWTDKVRAAGFEVTSTWLKNILEQSAANPRDAKREDCASWASTDLDQIRQADLLWFLVPSPAGGSGRGGYYEAGFADALDKHLVFSGDTRQSIFTALGQEFDEDIDAFACICAMRGLGR